MADVALNLVVIRSGDIERARKFFETIGVSLKLERHGNGPFHYASESNGTVLEIYPETAEFDSTASVRLGFRVPSIQQTIGKLEAIGAEIHLQPTVTPWGTRVVVDDPDGHRVELIEAPTES